MRRDLTCEKCLKDDALIVDVQIDHVFGNAGVIEIRCGCEYTKAELKAVEQRAITDEPERQADDVVDARYQSWQAVNELMGYFR